jgi:hypothetical protein
MDEEVIYINTPPGETKPKKKSKGKWLILAIILVFLAIIFLPGIIQNMKEPKNVQFIESLKYLGNVTPDNQLVDSCNAKYNTSKPQTYFNEMYDCLGGSEYWERMYVSIPITNVTKELLDNQCDCLKTVKKFSSDCVKYDCGGKVVRY